MPRRIVAFVIPAGYSFNLDGSTLYLAVASIFVAQAAGIHMSLGQQLLMMATLVLSMLAGVAGVPRGDAGGVARDGHRCPSRPLSQSSSSLASTL